MTATGRTWKITFETPGDKARAVSLAEYWQGELARESGSPLTHGQIVLMALNQRRRK